MTPQASGLLVIEERLKKVERQNRRFKQVGVLTLIVCAATLVMGQAESERTVTAEKFMLVDREGKMRATLSITEDGAFLGLGDATGKMRVTAGMTETGPTFGIADEDGRASAGLILTKEGPRLELYGTTGKVQLVAGVVKESPAIVLSDADGNKQASLVGLPVPGGEVDLVLFDPAGKMRAALGVSGLRGPGLNLYDASQNPRTQLTVAGGGAALALNDANGTTRIAAGVTKSGAAIGVMDANGRPVWGAPSPK